MGGVEHHGATDLGQDRKRAHVGDQGVVAERDAPLAGHDVGVARLRDLFDHVLHVPGGEELPLLHIDRATGLRRGDQQVGLAAEEGGDLQHVHRLGHGRALLGRVHVGQGGQAKGLADLGEHRQSRLQPDTADAARGGAVRLVERGLVDQPDPQPSADLLQRLGGLQRVGAALHGAGASDQAQRQGIADAHHRATGGLHFDDGVGGHRSSDQWRWPSPRPRCRQARRPGSGLAPGPSTAVVRVFRIQAAAGPSFCRAGRRSVRAKETPIMHDACPRRPRATSPGRAGPVNNGRFPGPGPGQEGSCPTPQDFASVLPAQPHGLAQPYPRP